MNDRNDRNSSDPDRVLPAWGCPQCGEDRADHLVWQDDVTVRCTKCGTEYRPDADPDSSVEVGNRE